MIFENSLALILSWAFYGLLGSRYDPEITAAKQTKLVIHSSKRKGRIASDISGLLELQF